MSTQTIAGLISLGLSGAVAAFITVLGARKSSNAAATEVLVRTSTSLLEPLRDEIAALRAEVERLRRETELCHAERDADRARLRTIEAELARYKAGPSAHYQNPWEGDQ